ncbi:MAG: NUDIX domain-containing protein [Bacteroidota bacterium]|nr:NUDIX domain-containing protein [Bacteroidota bacterium]
MYKVFVNNRPLFLINKIQKETNFQHYLLQTVDLESVISDLYDGKIEGAFLYHANKKEILRTLKEKIPVERAAGGLVHNTQGQILFIYRNQKWDLPKGGIEKGELKEEAAIREVMEETGVQDLYILKKVEKTYHIFKRGGKFKLKITHWYKMYSEYDGALNPQLDEKIEKAVWVDKQEAKVLLENSYENIKLLFE